MNDGGEPTTVKVDAVEIPKIQRDYAQGRLSYSEKENIWKLNTAGEKFITELFAFFVDNKPNAHMDLDFVYGSIETIKNTTYFYPLDGQQRLTTLFLLYWFIGGVELDEAERKKLAEVLKRFYYATRKSANKFCENLVQLLPERPIDFLLRKPAEIVDNVEVTAAQNLITQIEDFPWFHDSYTQDPTVQAMLNMLDRIQQLYISETCENIYPRLQKLCFYVLPLNNFDLTEELYIKMNARGKQLTNFENFKADFQRWVKNNTEAMGFADQVYAGREMPYDMVLINKMDNEWSAMFWEVQRNCEDKNFDQRFLSFVYKYWLHMFVLADHPGLTVKQIANAEDFETLNGERTYEKFDIFSRWITDASSVENFEHVLDRLSQNYADIKESIEPCWNYTFELFTEEKSASFKEQAIFGAVILYLQEQAVFNKTAFKKWMRIVWNIAENTDFTDSGVLIGVMQLFRELSPYSGDIYSRLADPTFTTVSGQSKTTVEKESQKAKLILSDAAWADWLLRAESHPYFKGGVSFLIPDDESLTGFIHNYQMALIFFDDKGISETYRNNGHIFLRALLSRYSSLSEIKYHITDTIDKENAFKNMLASDPVVRTAIKEWFALGSDREVVQKLNDEVSKVSPIAVTENDFEKKLHEALYQQTDLITWMQENEALRYKYDCVAHPNSPTCVYVKGYQNEIIMQLVNNGWECENQCYIGTDAARRAIPYFCSRHEILLKKQICHNGQELLLKCNIDKTVMTVKVGEIVVLTDNPIEKVKFAHELPTFIASIETAIQNYLATL